MSPLLPLILIGFGANKIHSPKLGIILKWTWGNSLTFFVTQAEELKHISGIFSEVTRKPDRGVVAFVYFALQVFDVGGLWLLLCISGLCEHVSAMRIFPGKKK